MPDDEQVWPPAPIRPPPEKNACPNCGVELPAAIQVCPICGAALNRTPPPTIALLCGFIGLLLMTACGLASALPAVAGNHVLLLLMVAGAFSGLILLAFAFVAAHWAGYKRR